MKLIDLIGRLTAYYERYGEMPVYVYDPHQQDDVEIVDLHLEPESLGGKRHLILLDLGQVHHDQSHGGNWFSNLFKEEAPFD